MIDLSSALVGMLMSSSKLFLFSNKARLNSGVRLLLELYHVIATKHVAFFIGRGSTLLAEKGADRRICILLIEPPPLDQPHFDYCILVWGNRPRSIYQYSSMGLRLSGQNCKFFMFLLSLNSQKRLGYKENNTKYRSLI